jgi:hypothetical protein
MVHKRIATCLRTPDLDDMMASSGDLTEDAIFTKLCILDVCMDYVYEYGVKSEHFISEIMDEIILSLSSIEQLCDHIVTCIYNAAYLIMT